MTTTKEVVVVKDIRSHRQVHRIPSYFDSLDPTYLVPPQGTSQAGTPPTIALLVRRDTLATSRALCTGHEPKVFGIIDFTAGYHQTPLHPDSQEYTAFITQYGLFEWNRVAFLST